MWSNISLRDEHIFIHIHMRALARNSLPAADPTCIIRSSGYTGEVDFWTEVCSIYEKKTSTLDVSVKWHPYNCLSTLEQGLVDNDHSAHFLLPQTSLSLGPYSSFSRQSIVRARVPSPPRVKPQVTPLEDLTTGLMEDHKRDTPYLPDN